MPKPKPTEPLPGTIRLLDVHQLARALSCSAWSIGEWCRAGLLPQPIKLGQGGKRLWRASQIEKALDKLQRRTYAPPALRGRAHFDLLGRLHEEEGIYDDEPAPRIKRLHDGGRS